MKDEESSWYYVFDEVADNLFWLEDSRQKICDLIYTNLGVHYSDLIVERVRIISCCMDCIIM